MMLFLRKQSPRKFGYANVWGSLAWLALLVFVTLSACDREATERSLDDPENDDRVHFKLRNTEFSIPKQYYKGTARTGSGVSETANLWALLPNFEGYDKAVNHYDFFEVHHKGRRIQLMLITRGRRMTVPQIVAKQEASAGYTVLGGRHAGGRYDELRFGLEYYQPDIETRDAVYLYRENGVPVLDLRCADEERYPYPGCKGYWDYNDEVAVQFDFGVKYLPQWQSILAHIQKLLDGNLDMKPVRSSALIETKGE